MLRRYVDRFLTSRKAKGAVKRTLDWYNQNLGVYLAWLAEKPNDAWDDVETIELFLAEQRDLGYKGNTVHARYRSLSAWFTWLLERGHIQVSPMNKIDPPKVEQEAIIHMSLSEYDKLFASMNGDSWLDKRDRCLLYLLFWCGLRIAETCSLRISDIDLQEKVITITRRKGGNGGLVPFGDDLGPLILTYLVSRPPTDSEWLFVGSNGANGIKGQFTPSGARQMMEKRCKAIGLRHLSPHKGRHGFATELLNGGLDLAAVSEMMGHSTPQTTHKKYAKYKIKPLARKYNAARQSILAERGH